MELASQPPEPKCMLSTAPEADTRGTMKGFTCSIRFLSENTGARSSHSSLVVAWHPELTSTELRQQFLGANNSMMMVQCGEIFSIPSTSRVVARHHGIAQSCCISGAGLVVYVLLAESGRPPSLLLSLPPSPVSLGTCPIPGKVSNGRRKRIFT